MSYRFVGGIGTKARNVPLSTPTDIATDTDEVGYSLTQRFYVRPTGPVSPARRPKTATPRSAAPRTRANGRVGRSRRSTS